MTKKLTITVSDEVYKGLHEKIGAGKISRFVDRLARPHVVAPALARAYQAAAKYEDLGAAYRKAAQDLQAEAEAMEWIEFAVDDALPPGEPNEAGRDLVGCARSGRRQRSKKDAPRRHRLK